MKSSVLYFGTEPPFPVVLGRKQYTINYDVEEIDENGYSHKWKSATLEPNQWSYGFIVSAIIRQAYPQDQMDAINNNYLAVSMPDNEFPKEKVEEYIAEFREMCQMRNEAKTIALELLDYAKQHNL